MTVQTAPCTWPLIFPCADPTTEPASDGCSHLLEMPPDGRAAIESAAIEYLWNWTGRGFGLCEVTVRPCRQDCISGAGRSTFWGAGGLGRINGFPWTPVIINGSWFNIGCGTCGDTCGCGNGVGSLRLPGPIDSIVTVQIGMETVPASAYRVDNHSYLVRQDGSPWPYCQDMDAPLGAPGTFGVTYLMGAPVPSGGQIAAGELACQLARAACGDKSCGLPQRVQSITRQGVTVAVLDAFDDIDTGHTGIWLIDSWVASVTRRPRGWAHASPDVLAVPKVRRQTWP